jgi:ATP-dependent helicase/nuclease subunit A
MIAEERLPAREGRPGRRVRPGDILVLVARRDALATALIRELKARQLPVAGADRLSLAQELAVQDLLALLKVATTPGDDLSLAALLRSPLCGLSEDELFALAWKRPATLWQAVMAAEARHPETVAMLRDLADHADFLRPYEFLERALIRHDGRRRLLARLGHEAEDPVDELLQQALAYETSETPSLAGFIAWVEAADIQVRREMEHGRDEIRVMTVHGAKGLEAPVVILPDMLAQGGARTGPVLLPAAGAGNRPGLMLWPGSKRDDDAVTRQARQAAEARAADERKRLLYVALTRAEDWLILCAAGRPEAKPGSWYELVERGMDALGAAEIPGPEGLHGPVRRRSDDPVPVSGEAPEDAAGDAPPTAHRPGWLGPAPDEERPRRMTPSTLAPHEPEGGDGKGREAARQHGEAVHLLLERLPPLPAADRPALARRLLAHHFPTLASGPADTIIAEALPVLSAPFAGAIFGADSFAESRVAIDLPEWPGERMSGRIDRLVLSRGRVLVVDFKSDARPPDTAEQVPQPYLVQLACYHAAVAALWPERLAEAAILWTATPLLMPVPPPLLTRALAARAISAA